MSAAAIAAVVVVAAIVVLVILAMTVHRRRVQQRFGEEYNRLVTEHRSQLRAQAELGRREWRVQRLRIRPLTDTERSRLAADWTSVQARFVDQPRQAVIDGGNLVAVVMKERGYPAGDADRIVGDLSVAHPGTVTDYRVARQISLDAAAGEVSTEDLRQAMIHYRTVFAELLGRPGDGQPESRKAEPGDARAIAAGTGYADPRVLEPRMIKEPAPADAADVAPAQEPYGANPADDELAPGSEPTGRFRAWVPRSRVSEEEVAGR